MQVASRFAIAVHILALLGFDPDAERTSEGMACSIGVNAVIVRNVTGMLRRAELVTTRQGVAGTNLAKPLPEITLLDVYRAVEPLENGDLFAIHSKPHSSCGVGSRIHVILEDVFGEAQRAMEARLADTTMQTLVCQLRTSADSKKPTRCTPAPK